LWNVTTGVETACIELDALVSAIVALSPNLMVAGGHLGLHWLEIVD
jgi:hypothetical protein